MAALPRLPLLSLLLCSICGFAAEGGNLLSTEIKAFTFSSGGKEMAKREEVVVSGQPFSMAMRFVVNAKPEKEWQINSLCVIPSAIAKGDKMELSFWARAGAADQPGMVRVLHQMTDKPWAASFSQTITAGHEWKQYRYPYTAKHDYAAKASRISLFLGVEGPQVIEIAEVNLVKIAQVEAEAEPKPKL